LAFFGQKWLFFAIFSANINLGRTGDILCQDTVLPKACSPIQDHFGAFYPKFAPFLGRFAEIALKLIFWSIFAEIDPQKLVPAQGGPSLNP
jgi:hypothetical protein